MSVVLGDKSKFAVEVGEPGQLRRVDLWAAGVWLTCDDNVAFVPQFRRDVSETAAWLRTAGGSPLPFAGLDPKAVHQRLMLGSQADEEAETEAGYELRSQFHALCWGPTTDNVTAHLFRDAGRVVITWDFWREEHLLSHPEHAGQVFVVEIPAEELMRILDDLVGVLDGVPGPSGP
ncbi:hypothetical protein [Streptomyces sp. NPDC008141]|uniref:hypothetical protein n=1 Tax=Streptomyces sp. NPDC008141 TaxID=3364815 RepID=UPI0036E2D724